MRNLHKFCGGKFLRVWCVHNLIRSPSGSPGRLWAQLSQIWHLLISAVFYPTLISFTCLIKALLSSLYTIWRRTTICWHDARFVFDSCQTPVVSFLPCSLAFRDIEVCNGCQTSRVRKQRTSSSVSHRCCLNQKLDQCRRIYRLLFIRFPTYRTATAFRSNSWLFTVWNFKFWARKYRDRLVQCSWVPPWSLPCWTLHGIARMICRLNWSRVPASNFDRLQESNLVPSDLKFFFQLQQAQFAILDNLVFGRFK